MNAAQEDGIVMSSHGFLCDLAKAHQRDREAAEAAAIQQQRSFEVWRDHCTEYLRVRFGIVLGQYHFVPSIGRVVFIPKLHPLKDQPGDDGLPSPLRFRLLRMLDGYLDLVNWPEGGDILDPPGVPAKLKRMKLRPLQADGDAAAWAAAWDVAHQLRMTVH